MKTEKAPTSAILSKKKKVKNPGEIFREVQSSEAVFLQW